VVRKFTANPRLGESSGVRIAHQWSTRKLQVRPVRAPEPGDVVVEQTGGRVYVGPAAARKLRGKVLDARDDAEGRVEFLLKPAEQS
jgi:Fe-S cluster assembly iron-binding protein IscA